MKLKNGGMLLLTAFIWGTAFVAQSVGMDYLGPFSFNGIRCLIGAVALLPCIWFLNRMNKDTETDCSEKEKSGKDLITGGIACGVLLFTAGSLQQAGIQYTTAGKAGFITAFYIVIVPVLGIFLHKKIKWKVWMAVLLALVGLYFCVLRSLFLLEREIFWYFCVHLFFLCIFW
ncbi:MAG: DMT family transporter [Dorea longicatena]